MLHWEEAFRDATLDTAMVIGYVDVATYRLTLPLTLKGFKGAPGGALPITVSAATIHVLRRTLIGWPM